MARDPDNLHRFADYAEDVPNYIDLPELEPFTKPDYDLNDEKDYEYYLRDIEKVVRGSFEYQRMVGFLRQNLDMNQCSFYQAVTNIDTTKIRIELHHEPLSLYDIVSIVVKKRIHFGESLEVEYVAKEVVYNHYTMSVGLIPLSETVHELVHNQYLFVPNDKVFGNWRFFVNQYDPWVPEETKRVLDHIEELTQAYDNEDYKDILARHYIYVNESGESYKLPRLEEVQRLLKDRVNDLINGSNTQYMEPMKETTERKSLYCPFIFNYVDENEASI